MFNSAMHAFIFQYFKDIEGTKRVAYLYLQYHFEVFENTWLNQLVKLPIIIRIVPLNPEYTIIIQTLQFSQNTCDACLRRATHQRQSHRH